MKQAILGQRRAVAVEGIGNELKRITGLQIDLTSGLKGNSEHRQLFMLERILEAMRGFSGDVVQLEESDGEPCYTLAEILAVEGMSKTSQKVLTAYFSQLESEQESSEESEQESSEDGSSN